MLFEFGFDGIDDPAAFADGQYLIGLHLREPFQLLLSRPLYLNEIHCLSFSQAEVEAQVALRHDARAAVDLVHLYMLARHHAHARPDGGAIALCFDLDPILLVTAVFAQKRRRVLHI